MSASSAVQDSKQEPLMARNLHARMPRHSAYPCVPVEEALALVLDSAVPLPAVAIDAASLTPGDVLLRDVVAETNLPEFRTSTKDGYAVRSVDGSGVFEVLSSVTATVLDEKAVAEAVVPPSTTVKSAVYITTGAVVPAWADAVVMVEDTEVVPEQDTRVQINIEAVAEQEIRGVGADVKQGELVLPAHMELSAVDIGVVLSATNTAHVSRKLRVGVLSTGSEVAPASQRKLRPGQVRDTNRPMLLSLLQKAHCAVTDLGIVVDDKVTLTSAVKAVLFDSDADVLVTSGGVSMGALDLMKPLLEELGTVHFGRVLVKPGKPITFATVTVSDQVTKYVFALPGNPVSCFVGFHLFMLPFVRKMRGLQTVVNPHVDVEVRSRIKMDPTRPEFHRVNVYWDSDARGFAAFSTGVQRSSRLLSCATSNGLLEIPQGTGFVEKKTYLRALLIGPLVAKPPQLDLKTVNMDISTKMCCHHGHKKHGSGGGKQHGSKTNSSTLKATTPFSVAILTVSDRASRGEYADVTGGKVQAFFQGISSAEYPVTVRAPVIVSDEQTKIEKLLTEWSAAPDAPQLIVTNGGTGFAPRDVTPEATRNVCEKQAPSLEHLMLQASLKHTPFAVLSRAAAGICKNTLVINLPGNPKAVNEVLPALFENGILSHAIKLLKNTQNLHDDGKKQPQKSSHSTCGGHHHHKKPATASAGVIPATTEVRKCSFVKPLTDVKFNPQKMAKSTLFEGTNTNGGKLIVGLNAFQPGQTQRLHTHDNMDKMYYVMQGSGTFLLDEEARQKIDVGDSIFAPSTAGHGVVADQNVELVLMCVMSFHP